MVAGKMLDPVLVIPGALAQQLFAQLSMTADVAEKLDDLTRSHQPQQVGIDDDAIKAVIKPLQVRLKKLKKELYRR